MGGKLPNHRFSQKKGGTVSRTESAFHNVIDHIHLNHRKSKSRVSAMAPNGLSAPVGAKDNDTGEIPEKEFRRAVETINTLFGLVRVFNTPGTSRDLAHLKELAKPGIAMQQKIDELKTTVATLTSEKDDEIMKLKAENERLTKDHADFEEKKKKLEIDEKECQQKRAADEKDFKQKCEDHNRKLEQRREDMKKKLEAESEKKIKDKINEANRKLEAKYSETERKKTEELERKTAEVESLRDENLGLETRQRAFHSLDRAQRQDIERLESDLQAVDPSRASPKMTFDAYKREFNNLYDLVQQIANSYFNTVPEQINPRRLLGQQYELSEASKIFNFVSASEDEPVAHDLRKSAVRHCIAVHIGSILKCGPFVAVQNPRVANGTFGTDGSEKNLLDLIYRSLASSYRERETWKLITLKAIKPQEQLGKREEEEAEQIFKKLRILIEPERQEAAKKDIKTLVKKGLEIWNMIRHDTCEINIVTSPPRANDDNKWEFAECSSLSQSTNAIANGDRALSTSSNQVTSTTGVSVDVPGSFAIFPRVTGKFDRLKDNNAGKKDAASAATGSPDIIHRGVGLFSNSPIFEMGMREFLALKQSAHSRKMSLSSPTAASQLSWPGGG